MSEYIVSYAVTDENVQPNENSNIWKSGLSVKDVADGGKYYWYKVTAIANRMLGRSADQNYIDDHQQELTQFTDVSPYYWAYYDIMEAVNEHSSTKQNGVESWSDVKKK